MDQDELRADVVVVVEQVTADLDQGPDMSATVVDATPILMVEVT